MEKLSLNTLREEFLVFFEGKGHLRMKSFSLVPENDKSVLLVNAGMTPLKPYFTGEVEPPSKRIATCQKCIRTLDIDRVGITTRHGTFFEMLGNFSFGDYFKLDAIKWSWEFLTQTLNIPADMLYASVYEEDDEAYNIWKDVIGLDEKYIVRMGKEDNFWEHGTGPCGPSSEIYVDRGIEKGCGSAECTVGCDCDRFVEVWNNVFTQFDKQEDGSYLPLASKNIDTGMGLERLACVMQDVDSLFEVDTIKQILDSICNLTNTEYGKDKDKDISIRVITDHVRSAVMMISDGIIPSNEGRGYILRRLLRRAARHGRLLGKSVLFLASLTDVVVNNSKQAYPELEEQREYIYQVINSEESKFSDTIEAGSTILNEYLEAATKEGRTLLSGVEIFKLHDTYGFPYDLTKEIAQEKGFELDKEGFDACMAEQKNIARDAKRSSDDSAWKSKENLFKDLPKTIFEGYNNTKIQSKVLFALTQDENISVVLDKTTFYAEGGGQQADIGYLTNDNCKIRILDCQNVEGVYIHSGIIESGSVKADDIVTCAVDEQARRAVERNHTATHMLQYALKKVLGNHVHQAGSYVDSDRLRFDYTHFSAMSKEEILKVQNIVNDLIMSSIIVDKEIMSIEAAREKGATALFGEKYEDQVRVVSIAPFSMELCGGTHLDNTGQTGMFKIVSEAAVASGVRRIEALTGYGALDYMQNKDDTLDRLGKLLKSNEVESRVDSILKEVRELKKQNEQLKEKALSSASKDVLNVEFEAGSITVLSALLESADMNVLRTLADKARERYNDSVVVLVSKDEKASMVVAATKSAIAAGIHSGNIIKQASAVMDGKGGGRPDMAQAGGSGGEKAEQALDNALQQIKEILSNG